MDSELTTSLVDVQPWELFETKMQGAGLSTAAIDAFKHNYEQLVAGVTGLVRACSRAPNSNCPAPPPLAVTRRPAARLRRCPRRTSTP
jgi:hypothetical protein